MSIEASKFTEISDEKFRCSGRGLLLPSSIEARIPIGLRATLYCVFLLYLFLGNTMIADIFMSSIEAIVSRKRKIRYPDPNQADKYLIVETHVRNGTLANLTLMALGFVSPEIFISIIEIVSNRFNAGELGPGTIVGSAAYNVLIISALCISAVNAPETLRIRLYHVFLITAFFGFSAYIWIFIVLSVISKDVVGLWEAIVTFLMFPVVVIVVFLTENDCFISKKTDEKPVEETLVMSPLKGDEAQSPPTVNSDELLSFLHDLGEATNLSLEDKAQLFAAKVSEDMEKSLAKNRMPDATTLNNDKSPDKLQKICQTANSQPLDGSLTTKDIDADPHVGIIEFASSSYAIFERERCVTVNIVRYGRADTTLYFRLDTIDGTATAGEDYEALSEEFKIDRGEEEREISIHVINDNKWKPDQTFFVRLSLPESQGTGAKLGSKEIALVTIINDSVPGIIEFEESITLVKQSVGKAEVKLIRINGDDSRVAIRYRTKDIDAIATQHYEASESEIVFEHGEATKIIAIPIAIDSKAKKDESFAVELFNPTGGAQLGEHIKTVVTIISDQDYESMANRMASLAQVDIGTVSVAKTSWSQQFKTAICVNHDDSQPATVSQYISHALFLFWKVLFAFIPPPTIAGGWLTFFVSLLFIALLMIIIVDVALIFGCLVGLKDSITGITFVALGISLPKTFPPMIAARHAKVADDVIGNIARSNSINVFFGLGFPWLIAAVYWKSKNLPFVVKGDDLSFSFLVFSICCGLSIIVLTLRRYLVFFGKAELGGPIVPKYICSIFFVLLWICYLTLSGLRAYGHI